MSQNFTFQKIHLSENYIDTPEKYIFHTTLYFKNLHISEDYYPYFRGGKNNGFQWVQKHSSFFERKKQGELF